MQIQVHSIPMEGDSIAAEELNLFLRSQKVLSVEKVAVTDQGRHFWSICIEYLPRKAGGGSGGDALESPGIPPRLPPPNLPRRPVPRLGRGHSPREHGHFAPACRDCMGSRGARVLVPAQGPQARVGRGPWTVQVPAEQPLVRQDRDVVDARSVGVSKGLRQSQPHPPSPQRRQLLASPPLAHTSITPDSPTQPSDHRRIEPPAGHWPHLPHHGPARTRFLTALSTPRTRTPAGEVHAGEPGRQRCSGGRDAPRSSRWPRRW